MSEEDKEDATVAAIRLLREAGHDAAAADLALKVMERDTVKPPADVPPPSPAMSAEEEQRRVEGEHILGRMLEDLNRQEPVSLPVDG